MKLCDELRWLCVSRPAVKWESLWMFSTIYDCGSFETAFFPEEREPRRSPQSLPPCRSIGSGSRKPAIVAVFPSHITKGILGFRLLSVSMQFG
jgi:hypothetical protein